MELEEYIAQPQVPSTQYWTGYDTGKRWSSYWIQIERALSMPNGPILEIGIGNGLVTDYLRRIGGKDVTTLDIDPDLNPDVVGDIVHLPFADQSFECVMACEVLEHMPFERATQALKELRRVGKRAIISVPNSGWMVQVDFNMRFRRKTVSFSAPWFRRARHLIVPEEHYWELEAEGYPEKRLRSAIAAAGWNIKANVRNPANSFHHFFLLE